MDHKPISSNSTSLHKFPEAGRYVTTLFIFGILLEELNDPLDPISKRCFRIFEYVTPPEREISDLGAEMMMTSWESDG